MPDRQCARCGRTEPFGEVEGVLWQRHAVPGNPSGESPFGSLGNAWTTINGADICPDCQSDGERRDVVARRVIAAIEREIRHNADIGAPPLPFEPGLVNLAMQLRDELSEDSSASTTPAESEHQPESSEPQRRPVELDVAITGAFLTGCPLRIGVDEYEDVQRKLASKLTEHRGRGWTSDVIQPQEGTYNTGGGFSSMLPFVVACRAGADALARTVKILNARPECEHEWLNRRMSGWTVTATSMRIEVYDLGVAVINGTFAVDAPAHVTLAAAARTLNGMVWLRPEGEDNVMSPITGTFRELSKETTRQLRASISATVPDKVQRPWLPASESDQGSSRDWGRLLWLHPVHILQSEYPAVRKSSAKELAPTFSKTIDVPDGRFVSGIGSSAIVTERVPSARDLPLRLVHLHWAYFALYMEIDRGLSLILDRNKASWTGSPLRDLEADASGVFDDYIRVMKARARVDSALASLGGDEQAVWDAIAEVQKFDVLVGGVDRKVEVLQRIADRRVQEATSASARRTAKILGFLTTLALVTLAIAAIGYFFGGLSDTLEEHKILRIVVFLVGVAAAVALWLWIFDWRPWRRRKTKRKDSRNRA